MARLIYVEKQRDELRKTLLRSFQSGSINFLVGSGASQPAISTVGNIEREIDQLIKESRNSEAQKKTYSFLEGIQIPNNALIRGEPLTKGANETPDGYKKRNDAFELTKTNYRVLLGNIERILIERKTSLLSRQASIFTTNYDLFIEQASKTFPVLRLNDGFARNPCLSNHFSFSPQGFFNTVSNRGNLYDYEVEIPCVNLIKIHGSLSWKKVEREIRFHVESKVLLAADAEDAAIEEFNQQYALILPQQNKHRETLLDRVHYDLLRIYSNELDREGTLLISLGFSFDDEHIFEITKRALKNPTLLVLISAFDQAAVEAYQLKFDGYNNVIILAPEEGKTFSLAQFNSLIKEMFEVPLGVKDERE